MRPSYLKIASVVFCAFVFMACAGPEAPVDEGKLQRPVLRVGVTSTYPPVIFKQGGEFVGVEADLARLLADELGMEPVFVELRWERLIPTLMEGEIDIIMSGMSVTNARKARIQFTDPYLKSGLVAMVRSDEGDQWDSPEKIMETSSRVGMVEGATGEAFVRKHFPNADKNPYMNAKTGASGLKRKAIDVFVHDVASVIWLVSENETIFKGVWQFLTEEELAWGVRRDDTELCARVNEILATWKQDGSLDRVFDKWLPYKKQYDKMRTP